MYINNNITYSVKFCMINPEGHGITNHMEVYDMAAQTGILTYH